MAKILIARLRKRFVFLGWGNPIKHRQETAKVSLKKMRRIRKASAWWFWQLSTTLAFGIAYYGF